MHKIYDHSFIPNSSGYQKDPEFNIYYEINKYGLRNPEIPPKSKKIRILVLGDSFTQGDGVNYEDSVSKKLNNYLGDTFEVINAGVASYSPTLEYLYLINDGLKLSPDIVILNYDNSDIQDDHIIYPIFSKFDAAGELIAVSRNILLEKYFNYTDTLIRHFKYLLNGKGYFLYAPKNQKYINNPQFDREFHTRMNSCKEFEVAWKSSFKYLKKIKDILDERHIQFFIAIYPYPHQVSTDEWTKGRQLKFISKDKIYSFAIADCFNNYTYGINFKVLNLLPYFKKFKKDHEVAKLYYEMNIHMTRDGYNVMAKGIYSELSLLQGTWSCTDHR